MVHLVTRPNAKPGALQKTVYGSAQHRCRWRNGNEDLSAKILDVYGLTLGKPMVARQINDHVFPFEKLISELRVSWFATEKGGVKFSLGQQLSQQRGKFTGNGQVNIRESVPQNPKGLGHPE